MFKFTFKLHSIRFHRRTKEFELRYTLRYRFIIKGHTMKWHLTDLKLRVNIMAYRTKRSIKEKVKKWKKKFGKQGDEEKVDSTMRGGLPIASDIGRGMGSRR